MTFEANADKYALTLAAGVSVRDGDTAIPGLQGLGIPKRSTLARCRS
ncbi:MAG: hypothetical protein NTW87_00200 [Planctomycetota bacterium]|nr:hypothetical protein [Planctomycetota bacterium]